MNCRTVAAASLLFTSLILANSQADDPSDRRSPTWLLPNLDGPADDSIPTLSDVVGHTWAEDVSSHAEIERYLQALAAAAPNRTRLNSYTKSYEGRSLYTLLISSPENLERLDEIRTNNLKLADPRETAAEQAKQIALEAPAIVWLAYGVHGNETSSCDAALVTAYHLLADRTDKTRDALQKLVVVLDPMQNPDGRERFINVYRETRGAFPQSEPLATEHTERWPGGRFNHYLFDMNRDWFLQSQVEARGRVAAYLSWHPQIYVDAHEMGRDAHYYFDPPMDPINDFILPRQREWFHRLGKHQAALFDQHGFSYTTREMFDAFYPGYGSTWPTMHGAIGVLWEQAGVRGQLIDRSDETQLHYHDAVRHHYISGLATIETAVAERQQLLEDFYQARADGVRLGRDGPVRDYFLLEGRTPFRTAQLAQLLLRNGIELRRVQSPAKLETTSMNDGIRQERPIPAGSYHIALTQPASRLVRILLDRHTDMGEDFVKRQLDRLERRLPDEIYDITAWSLPLAFGVTTLATGATAEVDSVPVESISGTGEVVGGRAQVAYLVTPEDDSAALALIDWLRAGLRVHVADQPLKLNGTDFAKGTLIVKVPENTDAVHDAVAAAAEKYSLKIYATDSGLVEHGAHLGGPDVHWVKPPRIAMVVDRPASYTAGHTWYLFDQVWHYPVTRVAFRSLGSLDLSKYNVLVLPDGNYSEFEGGGDAALSRLKDWIRSGGTLVTVKGAAAWAASDKVKLLATKREKKAPKAGDSKTGAEAAESTAAGSTPPGSDSQSFESPDPVPGAFVRATVYDDHWITFGLNRTTDVLLNSDLILSPVKPADGRNLVNFASADKLVRSGFCWPETIKQLANKPYVIYQPLGAGHLIAFADDPNFRAMCPEMQRLFLNAVLLGPGH